MRTAQRQPGSRPPTSSSTMASARRKLAIHEWLPNEVIIQVIEATPKAEQAALSRVSKLFHALAAPVLYRVVEIEELSFLEDLCYLILSKPGLAELVRSLTLNVNWWVILRHGTTHTLFMICSTTGSRKLTQQKASQS